LQNLDFRARQIHGEPDPTDAGTKHLDHNQDAKFDIAEHLEQRCSIAAPNLIASSLLLCCRGSRLIAVFSGTYLGARLALHPTPDD
ncbi:hypothetical protein, partial [uncultured Tateyamaria sp.]|uniref:hypothetical protein n=1 Tax=uncultured Tateyamaria sp. TaxID=455651 RepID=UPI0026337219